MIYSSYEADPAVISLVRSLNVPAMNIDATPGQISNNQLSTMILLIYYLICADALATSSPLIMGSAATDALDAHAIISTCSRMNWTFVNLVYENTHWYVMIKSIR